MSNMAFNPVPASQMKIILSRKGFDSTAGGVPSPILPDGRIVSLPIPDPLSPVRYGEIGGEERDIGTLVSNLTGGRIRRNSRGHLDPDLIAADRPRPPAWQPIFGQEGAAQGHLRNRGVGPGDVFVFFGLFQQTRWHRGRLVFDSRAPRQHLIWGWMQVDRVVPVADCPDDIRGWAADHPHLHHDGNRNNVLYLARDRLTGFGTKAPLPGSGVFSRYRRALRLTRRGSPRPTLWRVPTWLHPGPGRAALSYHEHPGRWQTHQGITQLQSAFRGQEFVLSTRDYPASVAWLGGLIRRQVHA
ncbi:hypothetical protein [Wenzhouxiangella sp. 15181]|uniref:Nmad3 family putative nucleotide modification protein n=2 Tax=unclassified Wenzhouxiangella TaxID=2613841 RepID=UPI001C6E6CB1|nr:hypothetical protein [Wenzhouxiangella sp. 15181]